MSWCYLILLMFGLCAEGADSVVWHPKSRTFDLQVRNLPLEKFLGIVKSETGWEIIVEPGMDQLVGAEFNNKLAADAMRLVLGKSRFSLLPRLEGGTRLTVYAGNILSATQEVEEVEQEADLSGNQGPGGNPLITLPIKIHYLKSRYVSINADLKATNLRPLFAGTNEIWKKANLRFVADRPQQMVSADMFMEKEFADLFKPGVPKAYIRQHQSRILHKMLPNLPDRGKAFHVVLIYTMPDAFGAVYMPSKGIVLMPQVKFAGLIDEKGVWKDGSPVFFAQSNILAHEIGHSLSLPHVSSQGNLMIDGRLREGSGIGPGIELTPAQIQAARKQALTKGPYVPGVNSP